MNTMAKRLSGVVLLGGIALAFAGQSQAATRTAPLTVTATVSNDCRITTSPIAFGTFDPTLGDLLGQGGVTATCTAGAAYNLRLNQGTFGTGTPAAPVRNMGDAANRLNYQLFQPDGANARTATVWGDTVGTGLNRVGNGAAQAINVFGTIPAASNMSAVAGSYTDTVTATIEC